MITILIFLLVLSVLIIVHELGHFFVARKMGIKAEEFGIGFPPRAMKLFKWKGTLFTLNWLPLGGFVRLRGEDSGTLIPRPLAKKAGFFWAQKIWKRALVLLAGVTMNMLLAILIFSITFAVLGIPTPTDHLNIDAVSKNSPAEEVGLKPNDTIIKLQSIESQISIKNSDEFINFINDHRGREINITISRDQKEQTIAATPRTPENTPEGDGALGVTVSNVELVHYPVWKMPFLAAWYGLKEALLWGVEIFTGLVHMVSNLIVNGKLPSDIAGPVGIASVTGQVAAQGILSLMQFMAILSVNLAIVNVLPIPALDGGRLFFLLIEKVRGRPINPKKEYWANMVGYALLIGLIILVTIQDVIRLITSS